MASENKNQSESSQLGWGIKGLVFLCIFVVMLFGLLGAIGKRPASLFDPVIFITFFGPYLIPLLLLHSYRSSIKPGVWILVFVMIYLLSLCAHFAYNLNSHLMGEYGNELRNWVGALIGSIIAPAIYCGLVAYFIGKNESKTPQEPLDQAFVDKKPNESRYQSLLKNPVIIVAFIQAVATLLAALIGKLF